MKMCSQAENRWARPVVLKLEPAAECPVGLIQKADSRAPSSFWFTMCISNKHPGDAGTSEWGAVTLRTTG